MVPRVWFFKLFKIIFFSSPTKLIFLGAKDILDPPLYSNLKYLSGEKHPLTLPKIFSSYQLSFLPPSVYFPVCINAKWPLIVWDGFNNRNFICWYRNKMYTLKWPVNKLLEKSFDFCFCTSPGSIMLSTLLMRDMLLWGISKSHSLHMISTNSKFLMS